jgi:hypothetical protein
MTQQQLDIARMKHRLNVAEKLLKPLSVLDLCGSKTMDYEAVKRLVNEFWASGVPQS